MYRSKTCIKATPMVLSLTLVCFISGFGGYVECREYAASEAQVGVTTHWYVVYLFTYKRFYSEGPEWACLGYWTYRSHRKGVVDDYSQISYGLGMCSTIVRHIVFVSRIPCYIVLVEDSLMKLYSSSAYWANTGVVYFQGFHSL